MQTVRSHKCALVLLNVVVTWEQKVLWVIYLAKGLILIAEADEDALTEAAIEAGADDIQPQDDGSFEIYTVWEDLGSVSDGIEAAGFKVKKLK